MQYTNLKQDIIAKQEIFPSSYIFGQFLSTINVVKELEDGWDKRYG